jgi:hypothetical protein
VFCRDHTPIAFKGGVCRGENFGYAMAIPFDIDNSDSDDPLDWISPESIIGRLEQFGINFWIVASRNHLCPKDDKAPRPKFHVYLPLAAPLYDGDKFVRYCDWCIKTFSSDPQVKSKSQKIFGYGDNPNPFIESWDGGRFIDEILTDADLAAAEQKQEIAIIPAVQPTKRGNNAFARFVESGEWRNHLADLQALGWVFFDKNDKTYFQTPDGNHSPDQHDGNIKGGVAYFFSRVPAPFKENQGYSICQLFAGALFGNINKRELARFAERYLPKEPSWRPFPLETLPRQLQQFVAEVSAAIGIDAANTAASVLSILSGIIGRAFQLIIKAGHRELAMLWVALVAESGYGKSPALKYARHPIDKLQAAALDKYNQEKKQYEANLEAYKQTHNRTSRRSKERDTVKLVPQEVETVERDGKTITRKRVVPVPNQSQPVKPTMPCFSVSDFTTEALMQVFSENPYGVCLVRDELAAFFNGMDIYRIGKVDRQVFIEIHDGSFTQVHRKNVPYLAAKTPSLSIVGGIQTDVICQVVRKEPEFLTSGFGARFLMTFPPTAPILWNDNVVDPVTLLYYERLVEQLLSYRQTYTPDQPGDVTLSPEAKRLIDDLQHRHASGSLDIADGNVRSVENKAGMHCARLALVLHIIHCAEDGIDPITPVTPETMRYAIVLTEWFLNESERVHAMFRGKSSDGTVPGYDRETLAILDAIRQKGTIEKDDLYSLQVFRKGANGAKPSERIGRCLAELRRQGIIESEFVKNPSGGRGKEVFRLANRSPDSGTIENPGVFGGSTTTVSTVRTNQCENELGNG